MVDVSRRSVARGAAWSIPAMSVAGAAPAVAASSSGVIVNCPVTDASYFSANTASISSGVVGSYSSSNLTPYPGMPTSTYLANLGPNASGTRFGISAQLNAVPRVPILNADGTPTGRQTSGYYLVPGCNATSCVAGQGYTLPMALPTLYDGYGDPHVGYIQSYTPAGCSPMAGTAGASMLWTIDTDILYNSNVCGAGPESHLYQISLPFSIIYLDGLTPVYSSAGTSCCNYINMTFAPTGGCTSSQSTTSFTITNGPGLTAPAATNLPPHIDYATRAADGSTNGSWCATKTKYEIYGANFTGVTAVTWNGQSIPFTFVNDNHITVDFAGKTGLAGIFYGLTITTADGTSNTFNFARQLTC